MNRTTTAITLTTAIGFAAATAAAKTWDSRLTAVEGDVRVFSAGEDLGVPAQSDTPVESGDRIETGPGSRAELALEPDSVLELQQNTSMTLDSLQEDDSWFGLELGSVIAKIKAHLGARKLQVRTPVAVCAVRGTEFGVEVGADGETVAGVFDEGKLGLRSLQDASVEETVLQPQEESSVARRADLKTRTLKGARSLVVRRLSTLKNRAARLDALRARRAVLRKVWRALSHAKRLEMRREMLRKLQERLRGLTPEQRMQLRRRLHDKRSAAPKPAKPGNQRPRKGKRLPRRP